MNYTKIGAIVLVVIIIIGGAIYFSKKSTNQVTTTNTSLTEPATGLSYPADFTVEHPSQSSLIVKFTRNNDFIEIAEKLENDPTCEKFYQAENFGFCVKGYHGEASSDDLANTFINLNK